MVNWAFHAQSLLAWISVPGPLELSYPACCASDELQQRFVSVSFCKQGEMPEEDPERSLMVLLLIINQVVISLSYQRTKVMQWAPCGEPAGVLVPAVISEHAEAVCLSPGCWAGEGQPTRAGSPMHPVTFYGESF